MHVRRGVRGKDGTLAAAGAAAAAAADKHLHHLSFLILPVRAAGQTPCAIATASARTPEAHTRVCRIAVAVLVHD